MTPDEIIRLAIIYGGEIDGICVTFDLSPNGSLLRFANVLASKLQTTSQDDERKRLLYLYKKSMDRLVKPIMSFEDWLNAIDAEMKDEENNGQINSTKSN